MEKVNGNYQFSDIQTHGQLIRGRLVHFDVLEPVLSRRPSPYPEVDESPNIRLHVHE